MAGEKYRFWSDRDAEPKRNNRWIMMIGDLPPFVVAKTGKPHVQISNTEIRYVNHKFNYPNRAEWQPITVTLRDPSHPDISASLFEILRASGYRYPFNKDEVQTISRAKAITALGYPKIQQLDADGNPIEEWTFKNAWISSVNWGELDYDSDDATTIEIELTYDYAEITKSGTVIPPQSF